MRLYKAAKHGDVEAATELLAAGADPCWINRVEVGFTAISYAALRVSTNRIE